MIPSALTKEERNVSIQGTTGYSIPGRIIYEQNRYSRRFPPFFAAPSKIILYKPFYSICWVIVEQTILLLCPERVVKRRSLASEFLFDSYPFIHSFRSALVHSIWFCLQYLSTLYLLISLYLSAIQPLPPSSRYQGRNVDWMHLYTKVNTTMIITLYLSTSFKPKHSAPLLVVYYPQFNSIYFSPPSLSWAMKGCHIYAR